MDLFSMEYLKMAIDNSKNYCIHIDDYKSDIKIIDIKESKHFIVDTQIRFSLKNLNFFYFFTLELKRMTKLILIL